MVFDECFSSDDVIGEANIKLSALCANGGIDEWWAIQYKGKEAGYVHLISEWESHGDALEDKPADPPAERPQIIYSNG